MDKFENDAKDHLDAERLDYSLHSKDTEAQPLRKPTNNDITSNGEACLMAETTVHIEAKQRLMQQNIIKNLIVISLGFFCLFTAFMPLQNLQSSLNSEAGLGTISLSIIYGTVIVSNLLLPPFVIEWIGCKKTIVFGNMMYLTYIIANFKSNWYKYTAIPAAVIVGIAGAPLWAALSTYINEIGIQYANLTHQGSDKVIPFFFGFFFMIFRSSQVVGNLMLSTILNSSKSDNASIKFKLCGKGFCPSYSNFNNTNLKKPDEQKVSILCGVYLGFAIIGCLLVILFLDNLKRDTKRTRITLNLVLKTGRHLKSHRQKCLIPLTIYAGMLMAFIAGDYTQAFVSCSLGIPFVGYAMVCVGATCACGSIGFGALTKFLGRLPIFLTAILVNIGTFIALLLWSPDPDQPVIFFVFAALFGMIASVLQSQLSALYGAFFADNQEAAFSNRAVWESVGYVIVFAYNTYLCINIKIYIAIVISAVSLLGYSLAEYLNKRH